MHRIRNEPRTRSGPETTGAALHWAPQYDVCTRLLGLGVNRRSTRMVVELAGVKEGEQVLDVGCGTGNLTLTAKSFAGASGAVHGIDAAPEMIEVARKKARRSRTDVNFQVGLVEKIPFPDASFDVVINRLMVHHLPDDLKTKAFAEILRVLRPGGWLLIADFNPPANPVLAHLALVLVGHGMMRTDVSGIPAMLSAAGFEEVSSGPTRSAFLAFVRAKKSGA